MASFLAPGFGGSVSDLRPGDLALFMHRAFKAPGLVIGLEKSEGVAALFVRHPDTNEAAAYAISIGDDSWGSQEVMILSQCKVVCDHRVARVSDSGISHEEKGRRGTLYLSEGEAYFRLFEFHGGLASVYNLNGQKLVNNLINLRVVKYFRWSVEWLKYPTSPEVIFSWPPKEV